QAGRLEQRRGVVFIQVSDRHRCARRLQRLSLGGGSLLSDGLVTLARDAVAVVLAVGFATNDAGFVEKESPTYVRVRIIVRCRSCGNLVRAGRGRTAKPISRARSVCRR